MNILPVRTIIPILNYYNINPYFCTEFFCEIFNFLPLCGGFLSKNKRHVLSNVSIRLDISRQ